MNDKVSIVVPTHNREEFIGKALDSALNQSYSNIEVIVVDNASTDSTVEIVRKTSRIDSRVILHVNPKNLGPVRNWREGLRIAKGKYLKFLWSDDWIESDFLEKTVPYLEDPRVAFAYCPTWIVSPRGRRIHYRIQVGDGVLPRKLFYEPTLFGGQTPLSPGCAIFRTDDVVRSLMTEIPNEDGLNFSEFGAGNDLLLFLLPLTRYGHFAYVDASRAYFRSHDESISCLRDLSLYYDYARLYFLNEFGDRHLLRKYKTRVMLEDWHVGRRVNLLQSIGAQPIVTELLLGAPRKVLELFRHRLAPLTRRQTTEIR